MHPLSERAFGAGESTKAGRLAQREDFLKNSFVSVVRNFGQNKSPFAIALGD